MKPFVSFVKNRLIVPEIEQIFCTTSLWCLSLRQMKKSLCLQACCMEKNHINVHKVQGEKSGNTYVIRHVGDRVRLLFHMIVTYLNIDFSTFGFRRLEMICTLTLEGSFTVSAGVLQ